jgi:TolB-like protein/tetratricopeptide (TPR) repeat protein/DNA-binding winged helix-turn-helix (wHTH) protein
MFVLGSAYLDPDKQLLTIGTRSVALPRKPYLVLLWLIENRHRMVYREELLDRFWEGKDTYDQSLSKAIGSIRKALGEPAGSELIETRWGLGYRYIGPFRELPSSSVTPDLPPSPSNSSLEHDDGPPSRFSGDVFATVAAPISNQALPAVSTPAAPGFWPFVKVPARALLASFLLASLIAVLAFAAYAHRGQVDAQTRAALGTIHSVAVLPFTAEGNREEDQYLGLELADAVAARLGTVPQLSVRSSATVRSVLGPDTDPALAGKKLEVQGVVKGDIHRANDKVVINVRLLDSSTGADLWSGTVNADKTNIFATEDSIAQQVSSALLPQVGMNAVKRPSGPDTKQPEAYSKYMKARFFSTTRTRNSLEKAIDLLHEAILIDPNYARAYAALADCYELQGFYQFVPPSEAYPRAKAAALKALSLDNSLAEAHVVLLSTSSDYDWDWEGAEREFKATIALDPNYAVAYQYYGYALLGMGRGEEALSAMKHAAELDPVSPSVQTSLAWGYYLLHQDEQAVDQCKRVLELYPDFVPAHQLLGIVYGEMKSHQRSMAELNQAETLERDSTITPILLDYELARTGKRAEASRDLAAVVAKSHGASIPDYYVAAAWTAIGDKEKAQTSLERAYQVRSIWVLYLQYDPRFDDLRPDPQFQALLHRVAFSHNASDSAQR